MEADGIFLFHPLRHALVLRISAVGETDFLPKQRHDIMVIFFTGPVAFQISVREGKNLRMVHIGFIKMPVRGGVQFSFYLAKEACQSRKNALSG